MQQASRESLNIFQRPVEVTAHQGARGAHLLQGGQVRQQRIGMHAWRHEVLSVVILSLQIGLPEVQMPYQRFLLLLQPNGHKNGGVEAASP